MLGYIYEIRNIVNNKYYIGSTTHKESRKVRHWQELNRNDHFNPYLQNAWNKYGEVNFEYKIISEHEVENKQQLYEIETELLKQINGKDDVYNMSDRGNGPPIIKGKDHYKFGLKRTKEEKEKTSNSLKEYYKNHDGPALGKKWTPELREKIMEGRSKIIHPNLGKHHSEEAKKRIGSANSKYIRTTKMKQKMSECSKVKKKIQQLDLNGVFIKEWQSIMEASKFYGITDSALNICLHGRSKSSAGFKWRYSE